MSENHISSPRPFFSPEENEKERVMVFGTTTAGIVMAFTRDGRLKINGYYESFNDKQRYACLRDPVELTRADLEEFWASARRKQKKEIIIDETPDVIDTPTQEYLDKLRKVTLNGMLFYIDPDRRERRPVSSPSHVFSFDKVLKKEE